MALSSRKLTENEECLPSNVGSAPQSTPLSEHDQKKNQFSGYITLVCMRKKVWKREEISS